MELEAQKAEALSERGIAATESPVVELHPNLSETDRRMVERLGDSP